MSIIEIQCGGCGETQSVTLSGFQAMGGQTCQCGRTLDTLRPVPDAPVKLPTVFISPVVRLMDWVRERFGCPK